MTFSEKFAGVSDFFIFFHMFREWDNHDSIQ